MFRPSSVVRGAVADSSARSVRPRRFLAPGGRGRGVWSPNPCLRYKPRARLPTARASAGIVGGVDEGEVGAKKHAGEVVTAS